MHVLDRFGEALGVRSEIEVAAFTGGRDNREMVARVDALGDELARGLLDEEQVAVGNVQIVEEEDDEPGFGGGGHCVRRFRGGVHDRAGNRR